MGGDNIRDWSATNPDLPFDREYQTTTQVAWTGSNQTFEKVSVYMMAWVNPNAAWCDVSLCGTKAGRRSTRCCTSCASTGSKRGK